MERRTEISRVNDQMNLQHTAILAAKILRCEVVVGQGYVYERVLSPDDYAIILRDHGQKDEAQKIYVAKTCSEAEAFLEGLMAGCSAEQGRTVWHSYMDELRRRDGDEE